MPGSNGRLGNERASFFSATRSGALYGSHGAPRAPLNSPGEQLESPRKQPKNRVFHSVDKFFPLCVENFRVEAAHKGSGAGSLTRKTIVRDDIGPIAERLRRSEAGRTDREKV